MRQVLMVLTLLVSMQAYAQGQHGATDKAEPLVWQSGGDVEMFWEAYTASKGGITWGRSDQYPEYSHVKEGDTFLVEVKQGVCLMEFFHSRWRRANDVRRWSEDMNRYGGCPYVFD
ncbi:hypothetical protein [Neptunomonas sp. XY-337]|uniref:hypothetical protein n=1 Tax=Neptunomonas sp. XY-337 TaxID=2561897 RepID=UPI0019812FE6|nr:hypothetical protein [Neptunomonas sp. XY-337]